MTRGKDRQATVEGTRLAGAPAQVAELKNRITPVVSVIVPTYNRRPLLLETLEALAKQEGPAFEVVIVDDASTDGTFPAAVARANELGLAGRAACLERNHRPPAARNVALELARADVIAFTDDDCLPAPGWLASAMARLTSRVGVVQGQTLPPPGARPPFFSHFIEIKHLDGTFATCNAIYRREAIVAAGGFDPTTDLWEDVDLGWRVLRLGWEARFAEDAIVYHQVVPQTPREWLLWQSRLATWPEAVRRYPQAREALYGRFWVNRSHAALTVAMAGLAAARWWKPAALLAAPYAIDFVTKHGLNGKFPVAKAALHLWWDVFGLSSALAGSIKHKRLVL